MWADSKRLNVANLVVAWGCSELAVFNVPIFYFDILFFVLVVCPDRLEEPVSDAATANERGRPLLARASGPSGDYHCPWAVPPGRGSRARSCQRAVPLMTAGGSLVEHWACLRLFHYRRLAGRQTAFSR